MELVGKLKSVIFSQTLLLDCDTHTVNESYKMKQNHREQSHFQYRSSQCSLEHWQNVNPWLELLNIDLVKLLIPKLTHCQCCYFLFLCDEQNLMCFLARKATTGTILPVPEDPLHYMETVTIWKGQNLWFCVTTPILADHLFSDKCWLQSGKV